jgi:surfeit locus 1 family protein
LPARATIDAEMTRRRPRTRHLLRVLGLTLLALVLLAAMTVMGFWQLDAYRQQQDLAAAQTAQAPPVPLDRLLAPNQAFTAQAHGRPVVAVGRYDDQQVVVARGTGARWLATPLVTDSGSAILVVRGVLDAPARELPAPPQGRVRAVGSLQPSQARGDDADPTDARVPSLSTAQLVGDFGVDLYSGYVVLTGQTPESTLPPATPPVPDTSFTTGLRNLMYALQWWVFGGFVVFMWWRILREDARVA